MHILDSRMIVAGVVPNSYAVHAAITACGRSGQWKVGVETLERMLASGVLKPDLFCFGAAIDAAARAGQWEVALGLLGDMRAAEIKPDKLVYT